jgi:hypothetical protein
MRLDAVHHARCGHSAVRCTLARRRRIRVVSLPVAQRIACEVRITDGTRGALGVALERLKAREYTRMASTDLRIPPGQPHSRPPARLTLTARCYHAHALEMARTESANVEHLLLLALLVLLVIVGLMVFFG